MIYKILLLIQLKDNVENLQKIVKATNNEPSFIYWVCGGLMCIIILLLAYVWRNNEQEKKKNNEDMEKLLEIIPVVKDIRDDLDKLTDKFENNQKKLHELEKAVSILEEWKRNVKI